MFIRSAIAIYDEERTDSYISYLYTIHEEKMSNINAYYV